MRVQPEVNGGPVCRLTWQWRPPWPLDARRLLDGLPELLGERDDPDALTPGHPAVCETVVRQRGLRIGRDWPCGTTVISDCRLLAAQYDAWHIIRAWTMVRRQSGTKWWPPGGAR
jgi:hypothetical protein